jgi:hypothetical protein
MMPAYPGGRVRGGTEKSLCSRIGRHSFDDLTLSDQDDDVLVDYGSRVFLLKNYEQHHHHALRCANLLRGDSARLDREALDQHNARGENVVG